MAYVFRLKNDNQTLRVKNDPLGWEEAAYSLKRSLKDGDGTFKKFNLDLTWIKDGAEFIRDAYEQDGIAALVELDVSIWDSNNSEEVLLFSGKLNMTEYEVDTSRGRLEISLPAEDEDTQTRFLSLRKKEVQITTEEDYRGQPLPGANRASISLHSQKLFQELKGTLAQEYKTTTVSSVRVGRSTIGDVSRNIAGTYYQPVSMDTFEKDTIRKKFTLGQGITQNFDAVANWFQFDFDSVVDILIITPMLIEMFVTATNDKGRVNCGNNGDLIQYFSTQLIYEVRDKDNNVLQQEIIGENLQKNYCGASPGGEAEALLAFNIAYLSKTDQTFNAGDKIYTYLKIDFEGDYHRLVTNAYDLTFQWDVTNYAGDFTTMRLSGKTTAPPSVGEGVMVYECLQRMAQHYIGDVTAFKSNYYGRTDLGYAQDGEGALRAVLSGYNLRGFDLDERPFFIKWADFIDGLEVVDDISFGFEIDPASGKIIVVVEKLEYFYDNTNTIQLPAVTGLIKTVYKEGYISTFRTGYTKWFGQKQSGSLEEFNTERQYFTGVTQLDKEDGKLSKLLAGAYAVESTRRLQSTEFDEDTEYDEQLFIIQVRRATPGEETDWVSESDQDIINITGVVDPEGVYNIKLTPARNTRRHGRSLASSFVNPTSKTVSGLLRFSQGGGNYFVESQVLGETQLVKENGDIDMSEFEPIWINEIYEFEHPLTLSEVTQIRDNPNGIIKFTDNNGNEFSGYIRQVDMNMVSPGKSKSTFKLLRTYG